MKSQDSVPVTYLLFTDLLTGKMVRLLPCFLVPKLEREFVGFPTERKQKWKTSIVVTEEGAPGPLPDRTFTILEAAPDLVAHIFCSCPLTVRSVKDFSSCEDKESDAFYCVLVAALKHNCEKQR